MTTPWNQFSPPTFKSWSCYGKIMLPIIRSTYVCRVSAKFFPYITMVKEEKSSDFPMLTNRELLLLYQRVLVSRSPVFVSWLLGSHRCLRVEPAELNVLSECLGLERRFEFFVVSLFILVLPVQRHILSGAFYAQSDLCACFSVRTIV